MLKLICTRSFSAQSIEKVLILSKISRLQFERQLNKSLNSTELKKKLSTKGSNYDWLKLRHDEHMNYLSSISDTFCQAGFDVKVVTKNEYTKENVDWSDLVITAGGDGTFLLGASRILSPLKPILGINTDPTCSQGYLCIPKQYIFFLSKLIKSLRSGQFDRHYRQRLRIDLCHHAIKDSADLPFSDPLATMHPSKYNFEHRFLEHQSNLKFYQDRTMAKDNHPEVGPARPFSKEEMSGTVTLPVRALNEVFVGEALSARVSYYEISIDRGVKFKQKSSGLTVSTGTGSTSWSFNICGMHPSSVSELLRLLVKHKPESLANDPDFESTEFATRIANEYNGLLTYGPEVPKLAYTIRDPVRNSIFSADTARGYAKKIEIRSRMMDAHLVIDGDTTFRFNDGAIASIYMVPEEDRLLCLRFRPPS